MKMMWHIFIKDLRRFSGMVALLAMVFAMKFIVGWRLVVGTEPTIEGFERAEWLVGFLRVVELVGSYFLTLRLIGGDPVVETGAFWKTRPISGGRLLGAKAFTMTFLLGVLPVLVSLPWWIGCGFTVKQIAIAAMETVGLQLAIAGPAVLVAVLTDSLARALLWTVVVVAVVGTWGLVWQLIGASNRDGRAGSSLIAAGVVVAITVGAVCVLQYLTRRLKRSISVAIGGGIFAALCSIAWPWNFAPDTLFPAEAKRPAGDPRLSSSVRIKATGATLMRWRSLPRSRPESWGDVRVALVAEGVPADLRLVRRDAQHTWRWPDGTERIQPDQRGYNLTSDALEPVLGMTMPPLDEEAANRVRSRFSGRGAIPPLAPGQLDISGHTDVSLATGTRLRETPPAYEFLGWFALVKPTLAFEVPLAPGPWRAADGLGVRIIEVRDSPTVLSLRVVDARFESALKQWGSVRFPDPLRGVVDGHVYVTADRARGAVGEFRSSSQRSARVRLGGALLSLRTLETYGANGRGTSPTLAAINFPEVTRFMRSATVNPFLLENKGESPLR